MSENEGLAEAILLLFILESKQKPFSSNANVVLLAKLTIQIKINGGITVSLLIVKQHVGTACFILLVVFSWALSQRYQILSQTFDSFMYIH